ncbi:MAG: hypothetical protein EHM59_18115 [Betaproteobacteria bacterium]|nr:MAG: hypothetical protein EHM59_18115 [Betaproteobacteria bacterium]
MSVTERVWNALTFKLEDKVSRRTGALKSQQQKLDQLTERVIRLEARLDLLTRGAAARRIK